jgi:hypothetical protein
VVLYSFVGAWFLLVDLRVWTDFAKDGVCMDSSEIRGIVFFLILYRSCANLCSFLILCILYKCWKDWLEKMYFGYIVGQWFLLLLWFMVWHNVLEIGSFLIRSRWWILKGQPFHAFLRKVDKIFSVVQFCNLPFPELYASGSYVHQTAFSNTLQS